MLTIWSTSPSKKVYTNLSPVLQGSLSLPVEVSKDYEVSSNTKVILAMGSGALQKIQEAGIVAKNRKITGLRNLLYHYHGIPLFLTYSAVIGEIDNAQHVDMLTDVALAIRVHETGSVKPVMGTYRWVSDFSEFVAKVKASHEATGVPVDVSIDTETLGQEPYFLGDLTKPPAYIVSIQLCCEGGTGDAVYFKSCADERERMAQGSTLWQQLHWVMNCPYIRLKGTNFKYDAGWFHLRKLYSTNFCFDTTLVGSLLDENRSNSLTVHTKIYVPSLGGYSDLFDRTTDKSRMDRVPPEVLLPYACGDTDATLQVAAVEKKLLLADDRLTRFYINILHPASRAFEKIERGGVLVDRHEYKLLQADLETEATVLVQKACKVLGGRIVAKHGDGSKVGGMNLTKASMLIDFFFSPMGLKLKPKMMTAGGKDGTKEKKPSTALEHIEMFANVPEAKEMVDILTEYSSLTKTYSTYVVGFQKHLRSDGRFHPSYFLFVGDEEEGEGGAVTGRLSAKAPAFQTIPKHTKWAKRIRRCFPAPPGYLIMERDFSQGELRVMACVAHVSAMIAAYKAGMDLHVKTSAKFAGYTYDALKALKKTDLHTYEETRQLGKAGNFGLIYGMMEEGFTIYARKNYGVALSLEEAGKFRRGFFEEYYEILQYHDAYKDFARKNGYVRGPLGRVRHLPLINSFNKEMASLSGRQAINSPIQMTLSDMLIWSLALENQMGLTQTSPAFGTCHDSAYNYILEDKAEDTAKQHLDVMQNLPFELLGWKPELDFPADAKMGKNMAEMVEIK